MLATMLLAGFGYYAFKQLPIDAFPDVSPTQVKIIVGARYDAGRSGKSDYGTD